MENVTHALYIAFAFFVFILAFSVSLFLVDKLNTTAKTLVYRLDETNYYDSLVLTNFISDNENIDNNSTRIVGIDTIIPTLYRYYKESFAVKILDEHGNLLQYFDTTTEGAVNTAKATAVTNRTPEQKSLISLYDAPGTACNMFGAPWLGSINKDAKARIDMYIQGTKGYINNTLVDYTSDGHNLMSISNNGTKKFKETFTQYAYEGDTYQDENDELVSLTGTKQISTKIVITYQLLT